MTDEHEHAMKVAKVIAKAMGDNFSDAFKNKQRWTAKRGMSGGRFRDVNEPFQDDYIAAAKAAAAVIAADRAGLVAEIARLGAAIGDNARAASKALDEKDAEIERLREAVGILEDGLQEVGDDYPGSSCQEWCQHQIKQARAALKDTRNDT